MFYKVLLVDDNAMTIESLRTTVSWEKLKLEVIGYADNGRSGLEMIQKFHPDIIITDIYMPELDGLSMIEECQKEIEDARMASSVTEMLMGSEVPPRKAFIYENAREAELDV